MRRHDWLLVAVIILLLISGQLRAGQYARTLDAKDARIRDLAGQVYTSDMNNHILSSQLEVIKNRQTDLDNKWNGVAAENQRLKDLYNARYGQ